MAYSMWKISYQNGDDKVSFYHHNYFEKFSFDEFYQDIVNFIVYERKLPKCTYNLYWIDAAGDKVEISSNEDLENFRKLGIEPFHFLVTPRAKTRGNKSCQKDAPLAGFLHMRVSCDGCNLGEIVGFRYKCMQCANYDLCENCESKHKHSEHLMLRMPNDDYRNELLSVTGLFENMRGAGDYPFGKKTPTTAAHKQTENVCPIFIGEHLFENAATTTKGKRTSAEAANTESSGRSKTKKKAEDCREKNKQQQPRCPASGISKFIDMLNDLAEGGTVPTDLPKSSATADEQPKAAAEVNIEVAVNRLLSAANINLAATAANEASKFAEAAAKAATQAAEDVTSAMFTNLHNNAALPSNEEQMSKSTAENNATSKILNNNNEDSTITSTVPNATSGLENLIHYIDPQYMKQGIQILNNFSDLFGKMLDSMETAGSSANASFVDSTATTNNNKNNESRDSADFKSATVTTKTAVPDNNNNKDIIMAATASEEELQQQEQQEQQPENIAKIAESRAASVEGDWQLVDGQASQSPQQLQLEMQTNAAPDLIEDTSNGSNIYQEFIADLREQLPAENNNNNNINRNNNNNNNNNINRNNNNNNNNINRNNNNNNNNNNQNNDDTTPVIYHTDERINEAVISMMAMGFSNEGAWLTQLLESVNGNIPEALDLMLLAQQRNRSPA